MNALVFDAGLPGAASHAAAGLFTKNWIGKKLRPHFESALPLLDELYGIRCVLLENEVGESESFMFVPPSAILEPNPNREKVSAVGDGWLEAGGERHEGWVYVAAGIWCREFAPDLDVHGRAGASFAFDGERDGKIRQIEYGRQAIAFVRDGGETYFSDGTAESEYTDQHERETLQRAASLDLTDKPIRRMFGYRPYSPGGPVFRRLGQRTWLATGGRKMGTILGASFARRLVENEIGIKSAKRFL